VNQSMAPLLPQHSHPGRHTASQDFFLKERIFVPMSRVFETPEEFLCQLLAHCQALSERYRTVSTLSTLFLEHSAATASPEMTAQFIAYTLTSWNLLCLSEKLEQAMHAHCTIKTIVQIITFHVSLPGAVRAQAHRAASFARATEAEKDCAAVTGDMLRAALGDMGETLLAPTLVRYVQEAADCPPVFWVVDRRLPSPLEPLEQIVQILRHDAEKERLDPHYADLAGGLLALVRRGAEYGRGGPGALATHIRSLSPSAFVAFIAQLFAESSAGNEVWHDDPASVMEAALRLVYRSRPNYESW